jgi:hypothetical protein
MRSPRTRTRSSTLCRSCIHLLSLLAASSTAGLLIPTPYALLTTLMSISTVASHKGAAAEIGNLSVALRTGPRLL